MSTRKYTTKQAAAILDVPWDIMFRWAQEAGVDPSRYGTRKFYTDEEVATIKKYLENRPSIASTQPARNYAAPEVVYEQTTLNGAVYLRRVDTAPPSDGVGYTVDRRQMKPLKPCGLQHYNQ